MKAQLTDHCFSRGFSIPLLGGAFDGVSEEKTPFGYKRGEGINAGYGEVEWICAKDRVETDPVFAKLNPIDGKITGESTYFMFHLHHFWNSIFEF